MFAIINRPTRKSKNYYRQISSKNKSSSYSSPSSSSNDLPPPPPSTSVQSENVRKFNSPRNSGKTTSFPARKENALRISTNVNKEFEDSFSKGINDDKSGKSADKSSSKSTKKPPVEVQVSYKINCISKINAIFSDFEIDCKIFYNWVDEKAIGLPYKDNIDENTRKELKLFDPDIIIVNQHELNVLETEFR
jgi:hypothetical protein